MNSIEKTIKQQVIISKQENSIVDDVVKASKNIQRSKVKELLRVLTENILNGTLVWNTSLVVTINEAIKKIDQIISKYLVNVIHNKEFKQLEGAWRGLYYLVMNSNISANLRIRALNITKREIYKDFNKSIEFDQSQLFKKIYENEFGMPGGEPYGILIGDYEFSNSNEDFEILRKISNISAAAFCPFISSVSPEIMGFDNWESLSGLRDLEKIFDGAEYMKWNSLRDSSDSCFLVLTMPRVLARLPYGRETLYVEEFDFEEAEVEKNGTGKKLFHENYCWMNAAYVLGVCITEAISKYGWATAIRGAEGGGKVKNLPLHIFFTDNGDFDTQCPTEVAITDRREMELSKLGFLPLCYYKNTDYAVFFGAQSIQKSKKYNNYDDSENAAISSRIPYILSTSRFAHYLKVMARDRMGSFVEISDCESWLNRWISQYVNTNAGTNQELKAKYPLAEARIEVREVFGKPGAYHAIAYLRPWLQFEELTASMRLVARIPKLVKN